MNKIETFERIFADRPSIHRPDKSGEGLFRSAQSALPVRTRSRFASLTGPQDWGVSKEFGRYLLDIVKPNMRTLETGAGISTLMFALGGSKHTAVAPWQDEMDGIRKYADTLGINMSLVDLVASPSEKYLPTLTTDELDIVFVDGKHAFPWPILDWYYTAERLKVDGLLLLDDRSMPSVRILSEFLKADSPRWQFIKTAGDRTDVFMKVAAPTHDIAWHEQPWVAPGALQIFLDRVTGRLRRLTQG